jgi:hypothetical protein
VTDTTVLVPAGGRRRSSLAVRITALCFGVAGVVAGLVSIRLADTVARHVSATTLADQADVVAGQLSDTGLGSRLGELRVATVLNGEGIAVVELPAAGGAIGTQQAVAAVRAAGITGPPHAAESASITPAGRSVLVEARPTAGGGFALVQRVAIDPTVRLLLRRDTLLSLGLGLLVAALAGGLLARLLSRPLHRAGRADDEQRPS